MSDKRTQRAKVGGGRQAALRVNRRVDGIVKSTMSISGLFNIHWPDYGSGTLGNRPVRTRMRGGVWEGGVRNPSLSLLGHMGRPWLDLRQRGTDFVLCNLCVVRGLCAKPVAIGQAKKTT